MFDYVRKHTKVMMAALFLLVIPAFVLVGINDYTRSNEVGKVVATVASEEITQGEWDAAHRAEIERIRASAPSVDLKLLDSPAARYATLERLVRDRVFLVAADKERLYVSDARLARYLQDDPNIGALRRPDGTLDMEKYRQLVGSQGMTPEMFESRVRSDLSARQVIGGVASSVLVPAAISDLAINALLERREVQIAHFAAHDYESGIELSDADLEAYYKQHESEFKAPESVNIQYVVLDLNAVKKGITINDADLKSYYDQNADRLSGKSERRASHILIASLKTAPAADRAKAKAEAEALLAEAKKPGADFAELAKKHSQDPGSAAEGGDLGFFSRGDMVKPVADAAFALVPGAVSDVVESDFGYHIIKLTDVKEAKRRSFDELRPEIEADLKTQQAQRKFAELAETFSNTVYEQADSLKPVADKLGLEVKTAQSVTRQPAPGAVGVLANPNFLSALFGDDALRNKRNTEAIDVGGNELASARITQHDPARTLPFSEVKDRVRHEAVEQRASELAKKDGAAKLAAWKADPAAASWGPVITLGRDQRQDQPPALVDAALLADAATFPSFVGVDLGAQGYAAIKVLKNVAPTASPADASAARQYDQSWTQAEALAYYEVLKQQLKVHVKVAKPEFVAAR